VTESIEKKLHEMKHQLGLDSVKSHNERYIERMKGITEKLEKDYSSKQYSSNFDNTFGTEDPSYPREKLFFKEEDSVQTHHRAIEPRTNDSRLNDTITRYDRLRISIKTKG